MALIKVKPTSAGRRAVVKVVTPGLHKGKPVAALLEPKKRGSGRNNNGHITVRHKGGGHKQHYRVVDFRRNKDGIPATVERLGTTPTAPRTSPCCATRTASVVTSLPLAALPRVLSW